MHGPADARFAALHDLLCRFQRAFDEHDWARREDCLAVQHLLRQVGDASIHAGAAPR